MTERVRYWDNQWSKEWHTVKDLIEALKQFDQDIEVVMFNYESSDEPHEVQLQVQSSAELDIKGYADEVLVISTMPLW